MYGVFRKTKITAQKRRRNSGSTSTIPSGIPIDHRRIRNKNRQPDYDKLYMIAQFFHVSTDYLISGKESQPIELSSSAPAANERIIHYQLKTIYMSLSVKSKQDLLEYANLLALRDRQ